MKFLLKTSLAVGVFVLLHVIVMAEEKPKVEATPLCPVTGKAIDKNVSVDYRGGKLFFSNNESKKQFDANTEKYASKANLQLVLTGQAHQKACPLMGKPVVADKAVTVAGVKVGVCCTICVNKLSKAKPEEQLEMVFGKGFGTGYTVNKS
jgi:YHS domain-containing protein